MDAEKIIEGLAKAIDVVIDTKGFVNPATFEVMEEMYVTGERIDANLLLMVLAERLKNGQIKIIDTGEGELRKEYFDKLVRSVLGNG